MPPLNEYQVATEALEQLAEQRKHQQHCPQCRTDPRWCETAMQYSRNFEEAFDQWTRLHRSLSYSHR